MVEEGVIGAGDKLIDLRRDEHKVTTNLSLRRSKLSKNKPSSISQGLPRDITLLRFHRVIRIEYKRHPRSQQCSTKEMSMPESITVLLVEDNIADADYVKEILATPCFQIVHVNSKAAALKSLSAGHFDLVLLDVSLPDSHGLDTMNSIIALPKNVPIVILTGLEDEQLAIQAVRHGAQDYIQKKDITETGLSRTIRYAIERKRAERLARERDIAVEASRIKSLFLANISHELRTLLAGILGMNELLLLGGTLKDNELECAHSVQLAAVKLLEVVTNLLDISSIELDEVQIKYQPLNLRSLVDAVIKLAEPAARTKDLKLQAEVSSGIPPGLGDAERLQKILLHLVANSVKFTERGGVQISVNVESQDHGQMWLKFSVSDTGIGIADEDKRRIFQAFTQVDSAPTRRYGGTGLGLTISKRLVDLMHGKMGLQSEQNNGSTFWFALPFQTAN